VADAKDTIVFGGRVLGPDGRPVSGAKVYLTCRPTPLAKNFQRSPALAVYARRVFPSSQFGTTGPDGRFKFTAPGAKYGGQLTAVTAAAANGGPGWVEVPPGGKGDDLTLRLVEDVPVTGQVVDLEGQPIRGATLRVLQIKAAAGEDLGPWLAEALKGKEGESGGLERQYLRRYTTALSPEATTDAEGHFRLTGIGRNRLVIAQLSGPAIASQYLHILTRPGKTIEVTRPADPRYRTPRTLTTYYAASFRHVAAPTKPVTGVVRDKDTKAPLAGVTLAIPAGLSDVPLLGTDIVRTTTDDRGRYRLTGLPKGEGNLIVTVPGDDQPYLHSYHRVPDSPGLDPVTVDVELKRGVWIEGRITDKVTGKPVPGSLVAYLVLGSNPNLSDYVGGLLATWDIFAVQEDGSFRFVGLPGPGFVVVHERDDYLLAPERDDGYGGKEPTLPAYPYTLFPTRYSALARVDPAKGVAAVRRDVTLDPGWSFTGRVLGPDGKPLAGARSFGLTGRSWDREAMKTAEFTVGGFNPHRPRDILFRHPEKGLMGAAQPPKGNGGSVTVRMGAGTAVTGRLVDAEGRPRVGVGLAVAFRPRGEDWQGYSPERIKTDREGRFRLEVPPGYAYEIRLSEGKRELPLRGALRPGGTMDLGDVQMKGEKH
jgi:protocatechuate 3,4-dioxygenase beta subunit